MLRVLDGLCDSTLYVLGSRAMHVASLSASLKPASSVNSIVFVIADFKRSAEDVFQVLMEDDVIGREVIVHLLGSHRYERSEVGLPPIRWKKFKIPLRHFMEA